MWGFVFLQVSITTEEVAECFPEQQEGSPEDWQKELCKDVAKESREVLGALGKRLPNVFHCFPRCVETFGSESQSRLVLEALEDIFNSHL